MPKVLHRARPVLPKPHSALRTGTPHSRPKPSTINSPLSTKLSRNAHERLLKIHGMIGARKYPNTDTIAAELEVSRKTIKRDLQFLKNHWQLPIEYDRTRHGFYYSELVDKFPGSVTITEAEMFSLLV